MFSKNLWEPAARALPRTHLIGEKCRGAQRPGQKTLGHGDNTQKELFLVVEEAGSGGPSPRSRNKTGARIKYTITGREIQ